MKRLLISIVSSCAILVSLSSVVLPRDKEASPILYEIQDAGSRGIRPAPLVYAPLTGSILLEEFTFDNLGSPDPQGWTSEDVQAPYDTFFHIDNFAGLGPSYSPLSGSKSLWCGTADTVTYCWWEYLPGYGDYWDQYFESEPFPTTGDVSITFNISYDCDNLYDFVYVEFLDKNGSWQVLKEYTGTGFESFADTIPADTLNGSVSFRFHFVSDEAFSDEGRRWTYLDTDGAVIIDDVHIYDDGGTVDSQDFESEAVGAQTTSDGDWHAYAKPSFGDYSGLIDGNTVLQEDPVNANDTHLWGFFNGSPDTYDCGGHPGQAAVPLRTGDGYKEKLDNRIYSPWMDIDTDINGNPVPFTAAYVQLDFEAYMENPLDNGVYLSYEIRFMAGGCQTEWFSDSYVYYWPGDPVWVPFRFFQQLTPGATQVQVAIRVLEMSPLFGASGNCHSHAPLIDNVRVSVREDIDLLVTSVGDTGPGTLRQAILNANAIPGTSNIEFAFKTGYNTKLIQPDTPLPVITEPVVIDGYTQGGASPNTSPTGTAGNASLMIELSGVDIGAGTSNHGLVLEANFCTIRGLAIKQFGGAAIYCSGYGGHSIEGNHIGIDAAGTTAAGNGGPYAINMAGTSGLIIGGYTPESRNVISGNDSMAIYISGNSNSVLGNLIGTDATGTVPMGNAEGGIVLEGSGNTIGGPFPEYRNVISANGVGSTEHRYGIEMRSPASGNYVQGNFIGTDITGTVAMGNMNGISISHSDGNQIGGTAVGEGNVIADQRVGIGIWWSGSYGNIIEGNLIGTDHTGTAPIGNIEEGIRIYGASDNTIGGSEAGAGNIIAYTSSGSGITLMDSQALNTMISSNSIHSNDDMGIDLGMWDGLTPNDSLDLDTGPNGLQNFPVLTSILDAGSLVEGSLHSTPLTTFKVEFFSNTACDPTGYGEGETYLGSRPVTTDASGDAVFLYLLSQPAETGTYLTATATDPGGNTSEFGECFVVIDSPELFEHALIDSIVDVPNDQGGWARIYFRRSLYDYILETEIPITIYDIHRRVEDPALIATILAKTAEEEGEPVKNVEHEGVLYKVTGDISSEPPGLWEVMGSLSARQREQYIFLVPTLGDSAATIPWTAYFIAAHTATPTVFFDSPADSGYSVDNIAPGVPLGMTVAYNTGSGNQLAWDPSPESDFQYYRVYRGTEADFVPSPASLVHQTSSESWTDPEYDGWEVYYKVTALDHAGNESGPASPGTVTGNETPSVPNVFALHQNVPNPFNPATVIRFDLPRPAHVTLKIYSVKGELITTLADGPMIEGWKKLSWTGRDDEDRSVASGVYFYRLTAGDFVQTKKMVLLR